MHRALKLHARVAAAAALLAAVGAAPAVAVCSVQALDPGALGLDGEFATLSTEIAGGAPARFRLTVILFPHTVEVDAPTGFASAPAGADTGTTFSSSYAIEEDGGGLVGELLGGAGMLLGTGVYFITVDAEAARASESFPAGSYVLEVVARCV